MLDYIILYKDPSVRHRGRQPLNIILYYITSYDVVLYYFEILLSDIKVDYCIYMKGFCNLIIYCCLSLR